MKRPASQNKPGGVLRMAFRVLKVFGTFDKRASLDLEKHGLVYDYVNRGAPAASTSIATKTLQIKKFDWSNEQK